VRVAGLRLKALRVEVPNSPSRDFDDFEVGVVNFLEHLIVCSGVMKLPVPSIMISKMEHARILGIGTYIHARTILQTICTYLHILYLSMAKVYLSRMTVYLTRVLFSPKCEEKEG
jgi:hypothetical protein